MLTREENELLCRVGPEAPMGKMLRRYWIPALRNLIRTMNWLDPDT